MYIAYTDEKWLYMVIYDSTANLVYGPEKLS